MEAAERTEVLAEMARCIMAENKSNKQEIKIKEDEKEEQPDGEMKGWGRKEMERR